MRYRRNTEETNFWAGYADCMLALFMIALLLWILSAGITAFSSEDNANILVTKDREIASLQMQISELEKIIAEKEQAIAELEEIVKGVKGGENLLDQLNRLKMDNISLQSQLVELRGQLIALNDRYQDLEAQNMDLQKKLDAASKENERFKAGLDGRDIQALFGELEELESLKKELNDKPPVINLTAGAAKEFSFPAGRAELTEKFRDRLASETFPELQKNLKKYRRVDTLEIIGHTDGRPINSEGNLDFAIPKLMDPNVGKIELRPGSNTDLGLMRALAIRNAWLKWIDTIADGDEQMQLESSSIRCYSAAQTVPPGQIGSDFDWLSADPSARRIEIRFIQLE